MCSLGEINKNRNKAWVAWFPDPSSQLCSEQQWVPQFRALEIHFLFSLELFTCPLWAYIQCMPKHACMHAHTRSHSGFNDTESSVTVFCHAPVLGLPDTACDTVFPISWFQVAISLVTGTLQVLCFPTSIYMGIRSTMNNHEASSGCLTSLLKAEIT